MLDCFLNYSVNPNLRFHSRIDKIIDDVIREKINIPHKFRMRLESRHCIESRIIYFRFRVLDKSCLQCNVFLKGLSDEMKEALSDERIDFAVLYEGIQGSQQDTDTDDKDGICGLNRKFRCLVMALSPRPAGKTPRYLTEGYVCK